MRGSQGVDKKAELHMCEDGRSLSTFLCYRRGVSGENEVEKWND